MRDTRKTLKIISWVLIGGAVMALWSVVGYLILSS